ncbi:hypothetical protein [Halobellus litoreus]|uniref:Uncharacterized protein n=1 Tax=Halobellus litoreus TaxID=755310 RepID=A0ABD6DU90_9EURY|nr:hypothetical protein [Halobellus litoreus]
MTEATHETSSDATELRVDVSGRGRLFGRSGRVAQVDVCPECSLVRLYAASE